MKGVESMRYRSIVFSWLIVLILLIAPGLANACTLWAAAGDRVVGGGTMIHKNRDWLPDHQQELRLVTPKSGYRYLSLYTTEIPLVDAFSGKYNFSATCY